MKNIDLGLTGFDFTTEILCWYLWGQSEAPKPTELRSSKWIDRQEPITLKIDPNEFFSLVGRDTFNAKDIKLFKTFFSGKTIERNVLNSGNALNEAQYDEHKDGKYYLTQKQFADLFYGEYKNNKERYDNKKLKEDVYDIAFRPYDKNAASISLYDRNILKPNFAKIAFAFGSVKLGLDTSNIRYVLDENLNPLAVENVRYKLDLGDFDFKGGEGSEEVNKILKQIADPSGIGKKVNLEFDKEAKIYVGDITKEDYASLKDWKDLKTKLGVDNPPAPIDNELLVKTVKYAKFFDEFNRIKQVSKVIDYLDENGKIVMFGSNENDKMVGTRATNFDYSDNVDADWFPDAAANLLLNHYKEHIPNGITYVGGKGSDHITGTDYDDILYGHDKEGKNDDEATDTLVGGKGSDKLYGGKGDDTLIGSFRLSDDSDKDELYGGDGFDTYYAGDKDIIEDTDGQGRVFFNDSILTGGTYDKEKGVYLSEDRKTEYKLLEDEKLIVKKDGGTVTIMDIKRILKTKTETRIWESN